MLALSLSPGEPAAAAEPVAAADTLAPVEWRGALPAIGEWLGALIAGEATQLRSITLPGIFGGGGESDDTADPEDGSRASARADAPRARAALPGTEESEAAGQAVGQASGEPEEESSGGATAEADAAAMAQDAVAAAERVRPAAGPARAAEQTGLSPAPAAPDAAAAPADGSEATRRASRTLTPLDGLAPPARGPVGTLGDAALAQRAAEERARQAAAAYAAAAAPAVPETSPEAAGEGTAPGPDGAAGGGGSPAATVTPAAGETIAAAGGGLVPFARTLEDLGFVDGLSLDRLADERIIFFPVPENVRIEEAVLTLSYDVFVPEYRSAGLHVLVDGRPVMVQTIDDDRRVETVDIPLDPDGFEDGFVQVILRQRAAFTDDRCFDERAAPGFLRVMPETGIALTLAPESIDALETAWNVLPPEVTIGVGRGAGGDGGTVTPDAFRAAWALGARLEREGRTVRYVDAPGPVAAAGPGDGVPHLVVAPAARLAAWLGLEGLAPGALPAGAQNRPIALDAPGSVHLVPRDGGRPVIVVTDPADWRGADLIGGPFRALANAPDMAAQVVGQLDRRADRRVPLTDLGLVDGDREVVERVEWGVDFRATDLPPGRVPAALELDIASTPPITDTPSVASVFFNGTLLWSRRLDMDGGIERFSIEMPQRLLRLDNALRVMVQREAPSGNCEASRPSFPVQIMPSSALSLGPASGAAEDFTGLAVRFDTATEIHLPESALARPIGPLTLLTRLSPQMMREPLPPAPRFYAEGTTPAPAGPFVLFGAPEGLAPEAPVRFDRGSVVLRDAAGATLLDATGTRGLAVMQLARIGDASGLWVAAPTGDLPVPARLTLSRGDIAFVDPTGVIMSLLSDADTVVEVDYPEIRSWFDLLSAYRYYLLAGLWVLVTVGLVLGLRRLYHARGSRE